jgi:hypothetical protein
MSIFRSLQTRWYELTTPPLTYRHQDESAMNTLRAFYTQELMRRARLASSVLFFEMLLAAASLPIQLLTPNKKLILILTGKCGRILSTYP